MSRDENLVKAVQLARRKRDATAKELSEVRATRVRLKARHAKSVDAGVTPDVSRARIAAYTVKVGLLDGRLDGWQRRVKRAEAKLTKYRARNGATRVSDRGVALVKEFEGFSPTAYDDGLGYKTIGWGFRVPEEYPAGRSITRAQADPLLREKLDGERYGAAVRRAQTLARYPLNQNQYDALLSFTFNLGPGWVGDNDWTIWRKLKARDKRGVADALLLYRNPGSPVEAGLRRRREAERRLFLS